MNNIELKLNISFEEYHDHFGQCECHEQELQEKFSEAGAMMEEGGDDYIILQKTTICIWPEQHCFYS